MTCRIAVHAFFAGGGGASCGFRDAGMRIAFALDRNAAAAATHRTNFPEAEFLQADIRGVSAGAIRSRMKAGPGSPILFSGCAPCQPHSRQNAMRGDPERDERDLEALGRFGEIVAACRPDLVFMENVPGLARLHAPDEVFGRFVGRLDEAGYEMDIRIAALARHGVPQTRRRLVLMASRHGRVRLPAATHGPGSPRRSYATVRDAIGALPRIGAGEEHPGDALHRAAALSELNLERIAATPEGGGSRDWPKRLKYERHRGKRGWSDVCGRMRWDAPAPTLTTRCMSYTSGRFGHPEQDRAISVREAACLQTFPRSFRFEGSVKEVVRQIGNAVPPRFARLAGNAFVEHLQDAGRLPRCGAAKVLRRPP